MTNTDDQQITPADATIVASGLGTKGPEERDIPDSLKQDMDLCLHILRVLGEFVPSCCPPSARVATRSGQLEHFEDVMDDRTGSERAAKPSDHRQHEAARQLLARAFATCFHLANLSRELPRGRAAPARERRGRHQAVDPVNKNRRLPSSSARWARPRSSSTSSVPPVFTAHPTEARRKASGKIRRIAELRSPQDLGGSDKRRTCAACTTRSTRCSAPRRSR
ncbi:MAG: phosphoenolpyruvate carboxylase [Bifidobacterium breve]